MMYKIYFLYNITSSRQTSFLIGSNDFDWLFYSFFPPRSVSPDVDCGPILELWTLKPPLSAYMLYTCCSFNSRWSRQMRSLLFLVRL